MVSKNKFPEYVPDHSDLWALAHHYLQAFLARDFCESFLLGTFSSSTYGFYNRFETICELLGGEDRAKLLQETDIVMGREHGDAWAAYKYRFPERGFGTASLDAVVRYARSIPEENWGVTSDHARTEDLEAALRAAIEEKATADVPEWAADRPRSPLPPQRTLEVEDEKFLKELADMDG
jgi:hypothetical protein